MKVKDAIRIIRDGQESLDSTLWEYRQEINTVLTECEIEKLDPDDKNLIELIQRTIKEDAYDECLEEEGDEWEIIEKLLKVIIKIR